MALACEHTQSDSEILHDKENRNQEKLQQQKFVAPLGAALRGRDDAANIGIGKHHDDARAHYSQKQSPASRHARKGGSRNSFHERSQTPIIAGAGRISSISNNTLIRIPVLPPRIYQLFFHRVPLLSGDHSVYGDPSMGPRPRNVTNNTYSPFL
jgi:hypothetical protein